MKRAVQFLLILLLLFSLSAHSYSEDFPKRIISLSPNTTEIIYAIGGWQSIVGVTIYTDYPPEAVNLPKVGGWVDPNLESIVAMKPDLVVMMLPQDQTFGDKIRKLGIKTLAVDSNDSIEDILKSILKIGKVIGREAEAEKLVKNLRADVAEIRAKMQNVTPRRVMFVVGRNPGTLEDIYVIGKTSYINEAITLAGGENIIENKSLAIKISKEAIFKLNPDVIIEVNHERIDKSDEIKRTWQTLKEVSAVKNNQVFIVRSAALLHPSQRAIEGAKDLARILHPELFERIKAQN